MASPPCCLCARRYYETLPASAESSSRIACGLEISRGPSGLCRLIERKVHLALGFGDFRLELSARFLGTLKHLNSVIVSRLKLLRNPFPEAHVEVSQVAYGYLLADMRRHHPKYWNKGYWNYRVRTLKN